MPSFIYSPTVEAHIATASGKIFDVSADITTGVVRRVVNGVSFAQLTLANAGRKYDGVFDTMDRVVIYLTRVKRLLAFSGYLDSVPAFSAFPGSVQLTASCTLKRLQNWYWDPTTQAAYQLLYLGDVANRADLTDGGLAKRIIRLLTQVAGWPQAQIHIGAIPDDWFAVVAGVARDLIGEATKLQLITHVGSSGYIFGQNPYEKGTSSVAGIGAGTGSLPAVAGRLATYSARTCQLDSRAAKPGSSPWYVTMRWPYLGQRSQTSEQLVALSGVDTGAARQWWMGRRLLVVNPLNNKAVCVAATGWGPADRDVGPLPEEDAAAASRIGATSTQALRALGFKTSSGDVHIAFAPSGMALGPQDASTGSLVTSGGSTSGTSVASGLGRAVANQRLAINFADVATDWCRRHQGRDYVFGAEANAADPDPDALDCSELVQWAHGRSGAGDFVDGSANQYRSCRPIPVSQARTTKGALVFVTDNGNPASIHHVGISLGNGTTAEAQSTKTGCGIFQFSGNRWTHAGLIPDLDYAGSGGSGTGGDPAGSGGTGDPGPSLGESLLNVFQWIGTADFGGDLLGGIRALMNDRPVMETLDSLVTAGLRHYCSAPNGDFIAWFPDYFGWWGTAAKMVIQPIEIEQGFTVAKSDANLRTHWFVTSSTTGVEGLGDATQIYQQYSTAGIASVEFAPLMKALFKVDSAQFSNNGKNFLARYGARPQWEPMDNITGPRQEFFFAVSRFMLNWASQWSAPLPLTFMPELWPGMLAVLPTYGVQGYVQEVEHTFDLRSDAGFSTRASCVAWSTIGPRAGIAGLPRGAAV
jgi:cell wall-associated NlpC family hydrolase